MLPVYQCAFCRHYQGAKVVETKTTLSGWMVVDTCPAFPEGIPLDVLDGRFNHRLPHPDDHGVRFMAENDEAEMLHRLSYPPL